MGMIGHEGPGEYAGFGLGGKLAQAGDKILTVFVIIHNISAFNSSNNHMVQCTGSIQAGLPWQSITPTSFEVYRSAKISV